MPVGVSVGGVLCLPCRSRLQPEEFLTAADEAMYTAKRGGKNQVTLVSLLTEEDRAFVRAVHRQLFSTFLLDRGRVAAEDLGRARLTIRERSYSLARLARKLMWLDDEQLAQVLGEQRRTRRLFYEVSLEQGLLTTGQVFSLLALQQQSPKRLGENLVEQGFLTDAVAQAETEAYYRALHEGS